MERSRLKPRSIIIQQSTATVHTDGIRGCFGQFIRLPDARKNKRNTVSQVRFERNLSFNLIDLYDDIKNGKYRVGRSMCFIVKSGHIKREIFAAPFRDRIVHHMVFSKLSPILDSTFSDDCYSCRKGKGTLYGARRLNMHMNECIRENDVHPYILKLDIRSYFVSIDRSLLYGMLVSRLEAYRPDTVTMELVKMIVFNDPTKGCRIKGKKSDWDGLPVSKSLFHARKGCGLPIGNLTSQLFSNVYLSALDEYVTGSLGFRHYGRYVDDFYMIDASKEKLLQSIPMIREFLRKTLHLELHPSKVYLQECRKGVRFLGFHVTPAGIRTDRKTYSHIRHNMLMAMSECEDPHYLKSVMKSCRSCMDFMEMRNHAAR